MQSRPTPGPATLRHHDAVIGCLRDAGFTIELAAHAISAIDGYLYGFTMQELNLPFSTPEETAAMAVTFLDQFPAEEYPHLAELTTKLLQRGVHTSVQALEADIRNWIKTWNENPRPFVWTKTADEILDALNRYCQRISGAGH